MLICQKMVDFVESVGHFRGCSGSLPSHDVGDAQHYLDIKAVSESICSGKMEGVRGSCER
jgi:hypothetical protein